MRENGLTVNGLSSVAVRVERVRVGRVCGIAKERVE